MAKHVASENSSILDHEKLDVFHVAVEFVIAADEIVENLPRDRGYLSDQLQRAALSISLNIAEGQGNFPRMKRQDFIAWLNAQQQNVRGFCTFVSD